MNTSLVQDGFSVYAAPFLSCLACSMANQYGDIETSQVIYELVKKYEALFPHPTLTIISRAAVLTHGYYYKSLTYMINELTDVLREASLVGAFNWGAYAGINVVWFSWIGSRTLPEISHSTEYGLQWITREVDCPFNRILLLYKHMADLVRGEDVDLTQPDLLYTYVSHKQPSIVTGIKEAKIGRDGNSWYSALFARLFIGVIFINRPNGVSFCEKIVRKLKYHHQPELVTATYVVVLMAMVNLKTLKLAVSKGECTSYLKDSALSQIRETIQRYKKMAMFNPSEWTRKLYFLQSLELEAMFYTEGDVTKEQVVNMYKKTLDVMGESDPIPYLEIGLASEFLNDFLKHVSHDRNFSRKMLEGIKYTPEEAFFLWGSKLKVKMLQQDASCVTNNMDELQIQELLFSLTSLPRDCTKEELLHSMMKVLLQYTGYNKGVFLVAEGINCTEIFKETNRRDNRLHCDQITEEAWIMVPQSLVSCVQSGKEPIVLDRRLDRRFMNDPYFTENRPLSVLCMSLSRDTNDVIYLENNFAQNFPSVDSLKIVMHQMMLIIEAWNAQNVLLEQVSKTKKARKNKHQQTMFIDALCHEMRNPLNGLFGSLEVLNFFSLHEQGEQYSGHWKLFSSPLFLLFMIFAAIVGSQLPKLALISLLVCLQVISVIRSRWRAHTFNRVKEEWNQILCDIQDCIEYQKAILDDTLQVQKLNYTKSFSKLILELAPISPVNMVQSVLSMFFITVNRKGLALDYKHKGPETEVLVDIFKLKQVIINFVSNAVNLTEVGSIKIRTTTVVERDDEATLILRVKDTGPGFSDTKKLFAKEQVGLVHHAYGSSGLGLSLVKNMIELMDGTISVYSELGKGSTFTVRIPAVLHSPSVEPKNSQNDSRKSENPENLECDLGNILVVDDNTLNRKTLAIYFARQNLHCLEAEDGEVAVNICKEMKIDTIVMDIKMPTMDGICATKLIRTLEEERGSDRAVIIGLSGNQSYLQEALDAGMNEFLTKPTAPHRVLEKLRHCQSIAQKMLQSF
eukprot:TRINITY_DN1262_c0_g1_i7.p1 TRINITY_DN1262_c0_g1~~TRINITY_DN1262_c0_g1_i7.p1  ORF type:complete len:1022 (+),score=153.87 TRINITY_DN1262_c0_g1_i7:438-3503(+)